ncbi:hypothetical protein [uncultured Propionivibrio sp.]|uniref:hypothetical protein n=1 Tax=uncultured Propionivibrio sp. TaxID=426737 RepID=UPI0029BFBA12|nr:hypothetical protein [uncultured Propionivibrio sp.]
MKFNGESIVVDADVARAAGVTEHPVSKNSRVLLQTLLAMDYKVGFCPVLFGEWKKHRSLFAKRWLGSMVARKKVVRLTPVSIALGLIDSANITEEQRSVANKDAHVVDAALASDRFIASNDKKARDVFCCVAQDTAAFRDVIWTVPSLHGEKISEVLSSKDDIPPQWRLTLT